MSHKLKALGVGLLAIVVSSSLAAVNASATSGGHFVSESHHTVVNQTSSKESIHSLEVLLHGLEGGFVCDQMTATGTISGTTVTEAIGFLSLAECHTTNAAPGTTVVHTNGCSTSITPALAGGKNTSHLNCPVGKTIVVTHPNCTITIVPQTLNGITTTAITENGKHAITGDVNIQFSTQYHAGICIFTGTAHTGTIIGSTTIRATDTEGIPVSVTAT